MDDLQRPPGDSDRDAIVARINRVHAEGRISTADRDIRLGNVGSAQSMAELDLMSRDLDQLEEALAPAESQPWSEFNPKQKSGLGGGGGGTQRLAIIIGVIVAIALVGGVAVAYIANRVVDATTSDSPGTPTAPDAEDPEDPADPADTDPDEDPPAGPAYTQTASGVRSFLAEYRKEFGTSQVVDLILYGDYVIVNVPVQGKARQQGWLYREGKWQTFGGIRATFPGSAIIETNRLDIVKMMRNVARAKRTLDVELPAQVYVILRYIPRFDEVPSVDIHVANQYGESGYLATTLDGRVERAYPYTR